jgi:hypothetical protein
MCASLCVVPFLFSCFEDPYEKIVIGSCRTDRPNEPGIIEHCQEYFQVRKSRERQADYCEQTGSLWSDDPCPAEMACGHCIEPRSTETLTTFWYAREDDPVSEAPLQQNCEERHPDNMWVDNPDVSCE